MCVMEAGLISRLAEWTTQCHIHNRMTPHNLLRQQSTGTEWSLWQVLVWETVRMLEATAAPSVWLMRYDTRQTVLTLPCASNQNTAWANADWTERVITTSCRPSSPRSTVERTGQLKLRSKAAYFILFPAKQPKESMTIKERERDEESGEISIRRSDPLWHPDSRPSSVFFQSLPGRKQEEAKRLPEFPAAGLIRIKDPQYWRNELLGARTH